MRLTLISAALCASTLAGASEPSAEDRQVEDLRSCMQVNDGLVEPCLGTIADPCQETADGATTIGITECLATEARAADAVLNQNYAAALEGARAVDVELGGTAPEAEDALRSAQRAWIAFRDAECGRLYALDRGGTIRSIVHADCMRRLTAQRADALSPAER